MKKKRALLIVDMQQDFVRPEGSLAVPQAELIIPRIQNLKKEFKDEIIIYTQDWHEIDDPEFKVWPSHCIKETSGSEIVVELKPDEKDIVIKKPKISLFSNPDAEKILSEFEEITVCGVATEYCVIAAVLGIGTDKGLKDLFNIKHIYLALDSIKGVGEIPGVPSSVGLLEESLIFFGKEKKVVGFRKI